MLQPFSDLNKYEVSSEVADLFNDYFMETAITALQRADAANKINLWIDKLPHDPEDSFIVMGQYNEVEFPISDLHSKKDAEDYLRTLKIFLILSGISWQLRSATK